MGWVQSVNRMQTFAFGTGYLTRDITSFYVKKGNSFDPTDITGKKIGRSDSIVRSCIAVEEANLKSMVKKWHHKKRCH